MMLLKLKKNLVKRLEREDKNETSEAAISSHFVWIQARRKV